MGQKNTMRRIRKNQMNNYGSLSFLGARKGMYEVFLLVCFLLLIGLAGCKRDSNIKIGQEATEISQVPADTVSVEQSSSLESEETSQYVPVKSDIETLIQQKLECMTLEEKMIL